MNKWHWSCDHHTFLVTVEDFQMTNEHAYMEVSLSDKSGAVIPLELYQHNIIGGDQHKDRRNPWYTVRYEVGKWSKFKIDIAFFRGVNESKKSYFVRKHRNFTLDILLKKYILI